MNAPTTSRSVDTVYGSSPVLQPIFSYKILENFDHAPGRVGLSNMGDRLPP
jgi:hypothetical protein